MNKDALRARMILNHDTQKTLAEAIGIALSTLNAKVNGTNGAEFSQPEIEKIALRYRLTSDEIAAIFFPALVS